MGNPRKKLPGPQRPREPAGHARERLLEAAVQLFSDQGYSGTSVAAICKKAGVTKPTLYWHFKDKAGLMAAVLETLSYAWIEEIRKQASIIGDPQRRLAKVTEVWKGLILRQPHLLRLPLVAAIEPEPDPQTPALHVSVIRLWDRAAEAVAAGVRDAMGTDLPELDSLGRAIVSLLDGAMLRYSMSPDEEMLDRDLEETRRAMTGLVIDRMRQQAKKSEN